LEEHLDIFEQPFLVAFDRPEVVPFGLDNLDAQVSLIEHSISTDNDSAQIHLLEQFGSVSDLIAFLIDGHLSQYHTLFGQIDSQQMYASGLA